MEKKKIFIVDDDATVLNSLKELLVLSGFEVGTTQNPQQAFKEIKDFGPALILLDLLMPHVGGLEICEMLNNDRQTRDIPVIVVSALVKEADIKKAYQLGIVGYITKPYDFQNLLHEITKAIASK